jgi:glutathione S-transferase
MHTLYYSPAATSFAVHVALEEAGISFSLKEVALKKGEQRSDAYLSIHPLGRVPALRLPSGAVLTETPAILGYIADSVPERGLMPIEPLPRARAAEWLSFFVSALHPTFLGFFLPSRYGDGADLQAALAKESRPRFFQLLQHVERRLSDGPFVLGASFSLCDPYAAMFFMWAKFFDFPCETLPRYAALYSRVAERAAFKNAFAKEGLERLARRSASPS